jgi:hypothetical protein
MGYPIRVLELLWKPFKEYCVNAIMVLRKL